MGNKSKIEWTEATWNPTVGCSVISPGCTNCYAMKMAARIEAMAIGQTTKNGGSPGLAPTHYAGTTKPSKAGAVWTGKLALAPEDVLLKPLRWKRPRMIFVNSMSDLFHESVPNEWIEKIFAVMAMAKQHSFQILTKRAERMREFCSSTDLMFRIAAASQEWPAFQDAVQYIPLIERTVTGRFLSHVWLGVSAEDQKRADERIPHLLETPAAVRFVSAEPLLGPISLAEIKAPHIAGTPDDSAIGWTFNALTTGDYYSFKDDLGRNCGGDGAHRANAIDWIIAGGESGPNARPMHPDWARSIRDQCSAAGVPFFFKQWGEWASYHPLDLDDRVGDCAYGEWHADGEFIRSCLCREGTQSVFRIGKRAAGRLLDGREHNEMPGRANG